MAYGDYAWIFETQGFEFAILVADYDQQKTKEVYKLKEFLDAHYVTYIVERIPHREEKEAQELLKNAPCLLIHFSLDYLEDKVLYGKELETWMQQQLPCQLSFNDIDLYEMWRVMAIEEMQTVTDPTDIAMDAEHSRSIKTILQAGREARNNAGIKPFVFFGDHSSDENAYHQIAMVSEKAKKTYERYIEAQQQNKQNTSAPLTIDDLPF